MTDQSDTEEGLGGADYRLGGLEGVWYPGRIHSGLARLSRRCTVRLTTVRISLLGSYVAKVRVSDLSTFWGHGSPATVYGGAGGGEGPSGDTPLTAAASTV
eukprot:13750-Prorocentrum_minimum.AAC.1